MTPKCLMQSIQVSVWNQGKHKTCSQLVVYLPELTWKSKQLEDCMQSAVQLESWSPWDLKSYRGLETVDCRLSRIQDSAGVEFEIIYCVIIAGIVWFDTFTVLHCKCFQASATFTDKCRSGWGRHIQVDALHIYRVPIKTLTIAYVIKTQRSWFKSTLEGRVLQNNVLGSSLVSELPLKKRRNSLI